MVLIEISIILLLILANGMLAMAEIAFVSARKARLKQRADAGDAAAATALRLANAPDRLLSTIQIGITLVGILTGAFGGATVADKLQPVIARIPLLAPYSPAISVGLVVVVITYLSLVIGELAPKQIALTHPEFIAMLSARPMSFLSKITRPIVHVLTASTRLVLKVLRIRASDEPVVTEEEVRILIGQGAETGVFEAVEEEMVGHVFRLGDRRVSSIARPRPDIVWLNLEDPEEINRQKIVNSRHTHFPVAAGSLDELLGFVRANDLLAQCLTGQPLDIRAAVQPPLLVPENMLAFDVLARFKETRSHIAFALDEFGGIQGVITLRDILEEIVGDLPQAHDKDDPEAVQREDGSWLLDGMLPVEDFKDLFKVTQLPGEEYNAFHTIGGFVMTYMGAVPAAGDHLEWENFRIEVMDMDGRRVDKVLVNVSAEGSQPEEPLAEASES